jgi:hypothetical protein
MDRIGHEGIEQFATEIYRKEFHGMTIGQWNKLLSSGTEITVKDTLARILQITDKIEKLVK